MKGLFRTTLIFMLAVFLAFPVTVYATDRVVMVGGGRASLPLSDFMLDGEVFGKGDHWYVDNAVSASGDGKSWGYAFKTIQEAITAADDWDTIRVAIGLYYDEDAALNITQRGLKLFGMNKSGDIWGYTSIIARAEDHRVITVNANDVEIAGFAFVQDNAKAIIAVATTVSTYKTFIHHCYFGGTNVTYGVAGGIVPATTYDSVDVAVQNCTFYQNATGVDLNGTRCTIRSNVFMLAASDVAINVTQTGGSRPELRIIDNIIRGANSGDSGITFTGTPTEALFIMTGNEVINVATPVTAAKYTSWYDGNYWGLDDSLYHSSPSKNAGKTIYVDKGAGTTGLDGRCWKSAYLTITEGIAALADNDTIRIAEGFYTEAAELTITESNVKIIGSNSSGKTRGPCSFKTPTSAGPMLTIAVNANDVEISFISFIATSGHEAIQLGGAAAGYVWRTHIHDCSFFGDDTGTYAIGVYGATTTPAGGAFPDVAECVVENNHFYAWATAAICTYGTRMMNKGNAIFVPANGVGIVLGAGRPFAEVSDNKILGKASGDTGILITGDDDGSVLVYNNAVANCATNITNAVSDAGLVNNPGYLNGTAPGQIDPT